MKLKVFFYEGHITQANYAFTVKPKLPTLGSIIEICRQGPLISFLTDDSIRSLLGFEATTIYEEYNLSHNPVDKLSFDNSFLECDIAQEMNFKRRRSSILFN